jgi:hypothetical protein
MRRLIGLLAALLLAAGITTAQAAVVLSVCNTPASLTVGDSGTVDICIAGLGAGTAPSLGVFDLDLGFDPAVLSYSGVSFGDPVLGDQLDLFSLGSVFFDTPGAGTVNLFELSLDLESDLNDLQASEFVLARLTFDAIGAGASSLTLAVNVLGDAAGDQLTDVTVQGSRLTVGQASESPIPEPGTLLLLVLPLIWLARQRHRTMRHARLIASMDAPK